MTEIRSTVVLASAFAFALAAAGAGCGPAGSTALDMGAPKGIRIAYLLSDQVSMAPVGGAKVCVYPAMTNCATSAADGTAVLTDVPASSEVLISLTAADHVNLLQTLTTGTAQLTYSTGLVPAAAVQAAAPGLGVQVDLASKGIIHVQTGPIPGGVSGVTFTAMNAGDGPFYGNATGGYDKTTTKTTAPLDDALFVNVPPGDVEVTYNVTGGCTAGASAWAGAAASAAKVKVVAGYLTNVGMTCLH